MRKLGVVAIVFAGLLVFGWGLQWLTFPTDYVDGSREASFPVALAIVVSVLPAVALLGFAVLLILKRHQLARRWFDDSDIEISADAPQLLRVGLIILGIALISRALASALGEIGYQVVDATQDEFDSGHDGQLLWILVDLIYPTVNLVMGIVLIAGSRWVSERLWSHHDGRLSRSATHPASTSEEQSHV